MELTEDIPLPQQVHPSTAPVLASGVVVKFQANKQKRISGVRAGTGPGKKLRRDFFEHDTRKTKGNKMKWTGDLNSNVHVGLDKSLVVHQKGSGGGTGGASSPPVAQAGEKQMNSKARRAAKFREMKVLQRIMLSKEVNIAQLLPNLTTPPRAGCCHCKCSTGHSVTEIGSNTVGQRELQQCTNGLVVESREVVKSCSVMR